MIRYTPKTSQPWLTPLPETFHVKRYGASVRAYSVSEMESLLHGDKLPNHYQNVNGLILPVTNEGEPIRD